MNNAQLKAHVQAKQIEHQIERVQSRLVTYPQSSHLQRLHGLAINAKQALESLRGVQGTASPYDTPATVAKRHTQAAERLDRHLSRIVNDANAAATEGVQRLDAAINQKAALKPTDYDSEIRALYRGQPTSEIIKAAHEALKTDDRATLAALLLAPSKLTGLPEEIRSRFTENFKTKHAPDEYAEVTALLDTVSDVVFAAGVAQQAAKEAATPSEVRRNDSADQAAKEAEEAFLNVLAGV